MPRKVMGLLLRTVGLAVRVIGAVSMLVAAPTSSVGQTRPKGVLAPGDAVVAGFSGVRVPITLPTGVDPRTRTLIDLEGPSVRIVDLSRMGGLPDGRLVDAPKPFTVLASQTGQVFATVLDNRSPPNIYVAATSAYGLPIVVPGADGQPVRARKGQTGATFMPGQWGTENAKGGPGSIWKIDGVTGAVTLFATVMTDDRPNSGAALGGLAFDPDTLTLFAADRETGIVHRFAMDGSRYGSYDHGVQGRAAAGLPPVAYDPTRRIDITKPAFDSERPATWGYAPPERRVFGIGVHNGRLYYSVADGAQIWSLAIFRDETRHDPRLEFAIPPAAGPVEVSKITFDDDGRMILAERAAPTGAFDFKELAYQSIGRVLRYAVVESYPGAPRVWQPMPADYAVGFPEDLNNSNGGVAIGFAYDRLGVRDASTCGGFLWSSGEELRRSANPALQLRLDLGGPAGVNGLQGNAMWSVRPANVPPLRAYFVDYDDRVDTAEVAGHIGDLSIWRPCGPPLPGRWQLPGWMLHWTWWGGGISTPPPPPDLSCLTGQQKPGYQCCPKGTAPNASGQCAPWCPTGAMDLESQKLCGLGFDNTSYNPADPTTLKCLGGTTPKAGLGSVACIEQSPVFNPPVCAAGFAKKTLAGNITICAPTPQQVACGPGKQYSAIDKTCHVLCSSGTAWPSKQCCAEGSQVAGNGQCCPVGGKVDPKTGQCSLLITVSFCVGDTKSDPKTDSCVPATGCPPNTVADAATGGCKKEVSVCLGGLNPHPVTGVCKPSTPPTTAVCPVSQQGKDGTCCPPGQAAGANGQCVAMQCPSPGKSIMGKCCSPADLAPGGVCAVAICGPSKTLLQPASLSSLCCPVDKVYTDGRGAQACCPSGKVVNGKCQSPPLTGETLLPKCEAGSNNPSCCSAGYTLTGNVCCLAGQATSTGQCCPADQSPQGPNKASCGPTQITTSPPGHPSPPTLNGPGQCCMSGLIPAGTGGCCAPLQVTNTGVCCPAGQTPDPANRSVCKPAQTCGIRETSINGSCCANANTYTHASGNKQCCAAIVDPLSNTCPVNPPLQTMVPTPKCADGFTRLSDGSCCRDGSVSADGTRCGLPATGTPAIPEISVPTLPITTIPAVPQPQPPQPSVQRPAIEQPKASQPQLPLPKIVTPTLDPPKTPTTVPRPARPPPSDTKRVVKKSERTVTPRKPVKATTKAKCAVVNGKRVCR